jgi:methylmalonyl-CoA mutase cobalamin-binding domain/chain
MPDSEMLRLRKALVEGDQSEAAGVTDKLLLREIPVERIVVEGVEAAMEQLDAKCTAEQFNLLEIMLAGRSVMRVMSILYPAGTFPEPTRETVALASLEGDVHDLGKNIVKTVLTAKGYRVVDCGKDCPVDTLLDNAEREAAAVVGVSGLLTSVIEDVRNIRRELDARGLRRVRVIAGGAALKQMGPDELNVDFVGCTAFDCLHYLEEIMEKMT